MRMSLSKAALITQIVEELSPEECKRLLYLCGELHTKQCTSNVKEILQSCMVQVQTEEALLMELMLRMRRYDLLLKVLGISKTKAEQLLENGHALSDYRVLMAELSEDVGSDDLGSLVFLLRGTLPKEKVEKFECFLDVVVELEKLDQISSTRTDVMVKYLRDIHRVDLAKRLSQYQSTAETQRPAAVKLREERRPCRTPSSWRSTRTSALQPHTSTVFPPTSCSARKHTTPCINATVPQCISPSKACEHQEEAYRIQSEPRGLCVIIDCVGNEGAHLEHLFSNLHFRVSLHMLLSISEVLSCLKNISRQIEHYSMDAFICCIITRSHSSQLLGTDSYGHTGLQLNTIRQLFLPNSCPGLIEKPKLFFIQGYEISESSNFIGFCDHKDGELETDSPAHHRCRVEDLPEEVPEDADIFWSHCWTNAKQLEDINHHSVYLQSLKEALVSGQKGRTHLVDLHMAVNRQVYAHNHSHPGSAYHINLRHTLRKNVYLS
ncbi:CASP8 and FADD-like apoptosis regulator [Neoarius graeffei]|uniref:CASP8 and FADD-like apoptosis regulator n=1 Tax=Neoarius graeffei TaxID=443677 RepID=UPI00298C42BB|nr:CASP8 and FADD-like apoptosis regulator [Neoarius graeffei]